jgi:hypothetical protein
MQGWSWMAALTIVATAFGVLAPAPQAAEPPPVKQKVSLSLRLDGLSAAGAEVEIKPGHAGCRFETIKFQTKNHPKMSEGRIILDPFEVETVSADRDCSFVITLRESGQEAKTVRRTIRISPAEDGKPAKPQDLVCYISSNSLKPKPKAVVAEKPAKPGDTTKRKD